MPKNQLSVSSGNMPDIIKGKPDKTDTYAGKHTARVTHTYDQPDGSQFKKTRKINKDGSITDKLEHRYN
ncbi:MAG: hypothetical protein FWC09_02285 [Lachnospiraceae bacterium]|nr:hypothetical protein [Lachnospiraceae bacterium]